MPVAVLQLPPPGTPLDDLAKKALTFSSPTGASAPTASADQQQPALQALKAMYPPPAKPRTSAAPSDPAAHAEEEVGDSEAPLLPPTGKAAEDKGDRSFPSRVDTPTLKSSMRSTLQETAEALAAPLPRSSMDIVERVRSMSEVRASIWASPDSLPPILPDSCCHPPSLLLPRPAAKLGSPRHRHSQVSAQHSPAASARAAPAAVPSLRLPDQGQDPGRAEMLSSGRDRAQSFESPGRLRPQSPVMAQQLAGGSLAPPREPEPHPAHHRYSPTASAGSVTLHQTQASPGGMMSPLPTAELTVSKTDLSGLDRSASRGDYADSRGGGIAPGIYTSRAEFEDFVRSSVERFNGTGSPQPLSKTRGAAAAAAADVQVPGGVSKSLTTLKFSAADIASARAAVDSRSGLRASFPAALPAVKSPAASGSPKPLVKTSAAAAAAAAAGPSSSRAFSGAGASSSTQSFGFLLKAPVQRSLSASQQSQQLGPIKAATVAALPGSMSLFRQSAASRPNTARGATSAAAAYRSFDSDPGLMEGLEALDRLATENRKLKRDIKSLQVRRHSGLRCH